MKTPALLLAMICAIAPAFLGCASNPLVPVSTAQTAANIVEPITQGIVPLVLDKNPGLAPALSFVADAIPASFSAGNLTAEQIGTAVHLINVRGALGLSASVETLIANGLSIAVTQYQQQAGLKVAAATDPGIQIILNSFSTGLHNGVVTWQAAHK